MRISVEKARGSNFSGSAIADPVNLRETPQERTSCGLVTRSSRRCAPEGADEAHENGK